MMVVDDRKQHASQVPVRHCCYHYNIDKLVVLRCCMRSQSTRHPPPCVRGADTLTLSQRLLRGESMSLTQILKYLSRSSVKVKSHVYGSRRPSVPCGCCTCLEFIVTQCSVYIVAGFLLSTSKDSPVHCVISSLTLNAILELNFVQCPCNSFCDSVT